MRAWKVAGRMACCGALAKCRGGGNRWRMRTWPQVHSVQEIAIGRMWVCLPYSTVMEGLKLQSTAQKLFPRRSPGEKHQKRKRRFAKHSSRLTRNWLGIVFMMRLEAHQLCVLLPLRVLLSGM